MLVHHGGKAGDLIYALPVMKALARQNGGKITIVTSALCYQIVPLLWEQSYIADVEMDYKHSYKMENGAVEPWAYFAPGEGINLSPQPSMYRPNAPVPWTLAYAEIAGIKELTTTDKIALPSLWNHRQWFWEHQVNYEDKSAWKPPPTVVLAPESESLKTAPMWIWAKIAHNLIDDFKVIVVGQHRDLSFLSPVIDLRGVTTMPTVGRLLAEAHVVVSSLSLPFHIARHAGTPTFCLQDQILGRSMPIDSPYIFYTTDKWERMVEHIKTFAPGKQPRTTLYDDRDLKLMTEAADGN